MNIRLTSILGRSVYRVKLPAFADRFPQVKSHVDNTRAKFKPAGMLKAALEHCGMYVPSGPSTPANYGVDVKFSGGTKGEVVTPSRFNYVKRSGF